MFPKADQMSQLLGHWVRERQALSLEVAVRLVAGHARVIDEVGYL